MKHVLSALILILAAALASPSRLAAGEAPWLEVKSAHFTVVTNAKEKTARRLAWQFEQVRALLQDLWPWARLQSGTPPGTSRRCAPSRRTTGNAKATGPSASA